MSQPQLVSVTPGAPSAREMQNLAQAIARTAFVKAGSAPFLWLATSAHEMAYISTPWESADEMLASVSWLRRMFRLLGVQRYSLISEAWMATVDAKSEPDWADTPPSRRDNRQDVLFITTCDNTGMLFFDCYEVRYPVNGKPRIGGKKRDVPDIMEGRMIGLLRDAEPN